MPTLSNHLTTHTLWTKVAGLGTGATFTGPELRDAHFRKIDYKTMYNRLAYLVKIGVVEKANKWTGDNHVIYKVIDEKNLPKIVDFSPHYKSGKMIRTAKGLYSTLKGKKSGNIVAAVDRMADQLHGILETAKTQPLATINNFTTTELIAELGRRTSAT